MRRTLFLRLAALWVLLPALALGTSACSDDDSGACDNVVDACDTLDAISCLGNTVQTCTENADGCLAWTDTEVCGANATCSDGECLCNDPCALGDSQCDGDVIQLCATDADGCYYWADDTDCADTGESCDDTADAVCVSGAGCGNDTIEGTEVCDGVDLGTATCVTEGFGGGTLACNNTCDDFITTACTAAETCGNNTIEGTEVCDGNDLDNQDCTDHGFYGGTLACAANCGDFDTIACVGTCGDATTNGTEVCDGSDLGTATCVTEGFGSGTLACATDCSAYDTTACVAIPPGSTCADAFDVTSETFPVQLTGTFDDDPATGFSCDTTATNVVWYLYTPAATGDYNIDAVNNTTDIAYSRLVVAETNACNPYGTEVDCVTANGKSVSNTVPLTAGTTYLIAFYTDGDNYSMVDPQIDIALDTIDPGETCGTAEDVSSATFPHQLIGTFEDDPATGFSCDTTATNVVWFQYTPTVTDWYYIDATNSTTDLAYSRLAVLDGTGCAPYGTEVDCVTAGGKSVRATVNLTGGSTYLIAFYTDGDGYTMVDPEIDISAVPVATIDWCNVQFPLAVSSEEGQILSIYGRLYSAGLTDLTTGIDPHPTLVAQVGVAPDGTDPVANPSLFVWSAAQPNVGVGNDDEYMADIIVPPAAGSPYDYAYRFSGDGGATWTYCDRTDNTYDVADAGDLTSTVTTVGTTPTAFNDVVITEVMQDPDILADGDGEWFELYNLTGTDLNLIGCVLTDLGSNSHTIAANFIVPAGAHATSANSATPGFTPGYVHPSSFTLANGDDEIYLTCGGTIIANVDWDGGPVWPDPTGASMSLHYYAYDETFNDDGANWCEASESYNGDLGTPNRDNPSCP